ncbi:DUF1642 domain-containing protein [Lactococcus lactis]|uniref:DUF1642 domain-containing protein n=1 Tax=Lactococcus lactis TaxID=1358 RepID=UPI0029393B65|nr:DUF1642 domain-containing protein [Lactococcus lactis]WOF40661.1 DUF1642 domain-containing protein [Lactococcus lactis]
MTKFEEEFNYLIELSGKVLIGQVDAEAFEKNRIAFFEKYETDQQQALPKTVEDFQGELEDLIDDILDDYISDLPFDGKKYKFIEKYAPQALPVVPEDVAKWIECVKGKNNNALALLDDDNMPDDVNEWLFFQRNDDNINLILRAWLDGYTVEKPQLFYIELPNIYGLKNKVSVSKVENGTIAEFSNGKNYALKLTEQEIKSIDERYWQFAVPVEEVE